MAFFNRGKRLWKDGQSTLAYVTPDHSFSREKRFKLYSIYWPENNQSNISISKHQKESDLVAQKISRLVDEEEKNQLRMTKGKTASAKKINQKKAFFGAKDGLSTFRSTGISHLSKDNQQVVKRLTFHSEKKQSKLRDRHGQRTNILQDQESDFLVKLNENKRFKSANKGFYTSRRIKLDLPHNYYPGPGSYEIKRYLQEEERGMTERQK